MNIAVRSNHVPGHEAVKSRCRPINVPGAANVVCGYRLREPGKGGFRSNQVRRVGYSSSDRIREGEQNSSNFILNTSAQARQEKHLLDTNAFVERTKKRCEKTLVDTKIKLGIEAYDEDLKHRREKLRVLLQDEEEALIKEIIKKAQRSRENYLQGLRNRTEESKRLEEDARLSFIKSKRDQQFLDMCPEARDHFLKKMAKNVKHCNLMQIKENKAHKMEEKQLEFMWHELMLQNVKEMKLREENEERKRAMSVLDVEATLREQIAGKEVLKSEERHEQELQCEYVRQLCEDLQKEEALQLEWERNKKEELKRDLKDQLEKARMCQAERVSKEAAMERTFRDLIEKELKMEEKGEKQLSNDLRREQFAYLRSLEEFREQEAKRNAEVEEIVQKYEKEAEEIRRLPEKERNEAKARELQKVLEIRRKQLQEKEEIRKREKERIDQERDIFQKQLQLDAKLMDYDRKCKKEAALRYQKDLIDQEHYIKSLRLREREEAEKMYRKYLQQEAEYQKLTENLLNS